MLQQQECSSTNEIFGNEMNKCGDASLNPYFQLANDIEKLLNLDTL